MVRIVLGLLVCTYWFFFSVSRLMSGVKGASLVLAAVVAVFLAALFVLAVLKGKKELRCTRESLEIVRVVRGRVKGMRTFSRSEVKRVQFVDDSLFQNGARGRLAFVASGKPVTALNVVGSVEAQKILNECRRLGYDVVRDVGMPMMVEMEESRRKSWLFPW
ncbi:MAG: hypothetical protein WBE72_25190 [Terracidiphilus sp.]